MASQEIKFHIASDADLAAFREVNSQLAKMAMDVGKKNDDLRQATMLAAREYFNLGDASEKAANQSVLSAKQIEEAWRNAMAKPTEEAAKGFGKMGAVADSVAKGIGGLFGKVTTMFLQGGVWGAMAAVATKAFELIWNHFEKLAEMASKRAERKFSDAIESIRNGAEETAKAFDKWVDSINRGIARFDAMTNSVRELTKAEIELAKQTAIANGMDAVSANAAADDLSNQIDSEAEERRLRNLIEMEQKRVDAAKQAENRTAEDIRKANDAKLEAEAEYQKKRDEYISKHALKERAGTTLQSSAGAIYVYGVSAEEAAKSREDAAIDFDESEEGKKASDRVKKASDLLSSIKTDEKALAAADEAKAKIKNAEVALETLATRREARELAIQNEIAGKVEEEQKKQDEEQKKLNEEARKTADARAEFEKKAAEKVAAERARIDMQEASRRERERQAELDARIKDHQRLLSAERAEESKTRSAVSAAESKLQRAWGWYRDKDSMKAQMDEEKADAAAQKQFVKDFERLKSRRRDWRNAENLSVDEEAVRRVAMAKEEKEAAEKHLAEIEKNTADLSTKLDELLRVKG